MYRKFAVLFSSQSLFVCNVSKDGSEMCLYFKNNWLEAIKKVNYQIYGEIYKVKVWTITVIGVFIQCVWYLFHFKDMKHLSDTV